MVDKNTALAEYFNGDELASNVFLTKYALRNKTGRVLESTPDQMHDRLAREFAKMEKRFGGARTLSYETIRRSFDKFKYIVPQGSVMFGCGNQHVHASLSNCVVIESPADNMSSIVDSGKYLANLFKRRCGVGLDISQLRPDNTPVNNSAGTTTGAWSFADFYSYICRMVGQNGRRGALMITMDVRHPDIEQFVTMKHDLTKVTGANVSIKLSDDFMNAVESDLEFLLRYPVDAKPDEEVKYTKIVEARDLWQTIINSATATAEPGLLMWDNIKKNLPADCYAEEGFETISTNPCAEIPLSAHDSCRLISINLKNFVKQPFSSEAYFDYTHFSEMVSIAMRLSDDLVELEADQLSKIIKISDTKDEKRLWSKLRKACLDGRRTGLGTHGLADALACLRLGYDSDKGLEVVEKIYGTLRDEAYSESARLAEERGAFPVFNWDKEKNNLFIKRLPARIRKMLAASGRRNISILTNAPTGSVSIMSQTSSGIEPVFRNSYIRRRKLSHNERAVEADFVDDVGDRWAEYRVFHHNVQEWCDRQEGTSPDELELPDFFVESDQISWRRRVEIQASIQKNIDHAISSTINLPKDTSPDVVGDLYLRGWKDGLKGITVYVDGSRSGVLITGKEKQQSNNEGFPQNGAAERPDVLDCDIHHTTIKGEKWTILIGLYANKPYEVLGGLANLIEIPKRHTTGRLTKHQFKTLANRYDLTFGVDDDTTVVRDIVKVYDNPNESAFTRMISLALRHGSPPRLLVEQLLKDKDSDMFSFARCIARILKNYITDGEPAGDKACPSCAAEEGLVYQDGCITCSQCGYAKCG
jgi:ribonucleoside-diphosphate reductase alpha chain